MRRKKAMSLSSPAGADVRTTRELIARYDAHAPRYTSYPTAAHFTPRSEEHTSELQSH